MSSNLPARQERRDPTAGMTAMEKTAYRREEAKRGMLAALSEKRDEIERALAVYEIPVDTFIVSVEVGLNQTMKGDEDFFTKVAPAKFVREALRAALVGLRPDGKQGAIVRFSDDCTFLPMVEGYVEVIWKTGLVADVNHNVVCEGDDFDFEEGDSGWVRHKRDLKRPANAASIGAWCVINLMTGGRLVEVVDQADLERISKVNKSTKGPRSQGWNREMDRKAPFRRVVKRMPKTERISMLIELEDRNVRLENAQAAEADDAPSSKALFGSRPIRRKAKPAAAEPPIDVEVEVKGPAAAHDQDGGDRQQEANNSGEADTPAGGEAEGGSPAAESPPFVLRAVLSKKNGLQEFDNVDLWYGDIRQKMQTLAADLLPAFWTINRPHVEDAGRNGHGAEAMKLIAYAKELGLMEVSHGDQ